MRKKLRKFFGILGPGFISGASDDDPSGIATYSQTGAQFGYSQLWLGVFSLPFLITIQEMCGRIGMVTGRGLAAVIKKHYSVQVLYVAVTILFIANAINIGADLGAMAASLQLLVPIRFEVLLIGITLLTVLLEVFVSYHNYAKILKYFALSLFAYVGVAFAVKQEWSTALWATVFPSFSLSPAYVMNMVAFLGTTISPYLFFWQASEEVEGQVENGRLKSLNRGTPKVFPRDILAMQKDTFFGMIFSNVIAFFIILTAASTLGRAGITTVSTPQEAAAVLRPIAGDFAFLFFALGIVGTGLLAVPVLAGSAAYAVSEVFGWREGLSCSLRKAPGFYGVIVVATLLGVLINLTPIKPFQLLYYTAILNGLCAPPLILLVLLISNNQEIMGKRTNNVVSNLLGGVILIVMTGCAGALLWNLF